MRKLLMGLLLVVILAVVAVVAFLAIPSPLQKWAVERGGTAALGRQVTLGEPFRLRVWPPIEITAADVHVANADWGSAPELATVASLDAKVDLLAYWRDRRIQVDRLLVTRPQVALEVNQDGRRNWDFAKQDGAAAATPNDAQPRSIPPFVLGEVRVEDGQVGYDDRAGGTSRRADAIELAITQSGPDQPVAIDGGLTLDGKRATLAGTVVRPQGAVAGDKSPIQLDLGVPGATASFDGEIQTSGPAANGAVDVQITAPKDLLAWIGGPSSIAGLPGSAELQGKVDVTSSRVAVGDLKLRADEIAGSGRAAVDLAQPPHVTAELALGKLDLTPYLGGETAGGKAPVAGGPPRTGAVWPDTPIDLPLPLPVDLDLRLRGDGLKAGKVEIGKYATHVEADRKQALVTIDELQAYGGGMKGKLRAEPGTPPAYGVDLDGNGIGVLAASQALTGLSRIDGRADLRLGLTSKGASVRKLVSGLGGDGHVTIRDGAVIGINIAAVLRHIMTLGLDSSATQEQRTDFAEAGANFRVENGIVRTQDLHLSAPVLRLDGQGSVDLPQLTIDMRVTPKLASTLEGQGAKGEPTLQAGIPFLIQGPYTAPTVRFDLNGTLTAAIDGPEDVEQLAADLAKNPEAVQFLRDEFGLVPTPAADKALEAIQGLLGGGGTGKQKNDSKPSDLGKAARGLLKGLTGQ